MGAFLGPADGLVEFAHWRESQARATVRPVTYRTTLGGTRKAFFGPRPLRQWEMVATDMDPEQFGPFELLLSQSPGPYVFLDQLAQVTNVLTPRASMPGAGNENEFGGTGSVSSGVIPGIGRVPAITALAGQGIWFGYRTPVIPGKPVTVSAFVRGSGSGQIQAVFVGADGTAVSTVTSNYTTPAGWERVWVAGTPPQTAREVRIYVHSTSGHAAAVPAVTWTPELMPWSTGRGCAKAVISEYDDEFQWADPQAQGQRLSSFKFTVTEVGDGSQR